ncbi:MAG: hypothetical protein J7K40_11500 [candidate division Zixibacteria bacterium]|nr:hypothetical protein [candidate division Zixibacteria bacterium]
MANKHDLKIVKADFSGMDVVKVLDAVPDGKTRFICMVKEKLVGAVANINGVSIIDGVADNSATPVVDHTHVAAVEVITNLIFPNGVDVDNPLFSIAEKRFLNIKGAHADGAGTVEFVYFDE